MGVVKLTPAQKRIIDAMRGDKVLIRESGKYWLALKVHPGYGYQMDTVSTAAVNKLVSLGYIAAGEAVRAHKETYAVVESKFA